MWRLIFALILSRGYKAVFNMNDEKCDVPHVRCLANVGKEGECYMM